MGTVIVALMIGIIVGSLSGLVGIGGGILLIPFLLYVFRLGMHSAAGTSLSIVLPMSLVGAISHFHRGNVELRLTLLIGIGAVAGSFLGVWIGGLLPPQTLKKIFALILLTVALKVVADAFEIRLPFSPAPSPAAVTEIGATAEERERTTEAAPGQNNPRAG